MYDHQLFNYYVHTVNLRVQVPNAYATPKPLVPNKTNPNVLFPFHYKAHAYDGPFRPVNFKGLWPNFSVIYSLYFYIMSCSTLL